MPSPSHSILSIQSAEHNRGESQRRGCQIYSIPANHFVSHFVQRSRGRAIAGDSTNIKPASINQCKAMVQPQKEAKPNESKQGAYHKLRAWPLVSKFYPGRRLFTQAFPSNIWKCYGASYHSEMPNFQTYCVTRKIYKPMPDHE